MGLLYLLPYLRYTYVFHRDSVFCHNCTVILTARWDPSGKNKTDVLELRNHFDFLLFILYKGLMMDQLINPKHAACT